jgi:hypothetical protein
MQRIDLFVSRSSQLISLIINRLTADQPERLKTLRALAKENAKFLDKVIENDRIFENENYVRLTA